MPPPYSLYLRRVRAYRVVRRDDVHRVLSRFNSAGEITAARARMNPYPVSPDELQHHPLEHVCVESYWSDVQIDPDWVAAFRFTPQNGHPVISEVRIFPAEPHPEGGPGRWSQGPGRWSAELLGDHAPVPPGGVTARLVRNKVPVGDALRAARASLDSLPRDAAHLFGPGADYAPFTPGAARQALAQRGPGRKGHGPLFFAELAAEYAKLLDAGGVHPIVTLARRRKLTPARIRDMIYRARKRMGLLTDAPKQGRFGGQLTPKARAILKAAGTVPKNVPASTRGKVKSGQRQPRIKTKTPR